MNIIFATETDETSGTGCGYQLLAISRPVQEIIRISQPTRAGYAEMVAAWLAMPLQVVSTFPILLRARWGQTQQSRAHIVHIEDEEQLP